VSNSAALSKGLGFHPPPPPRTKWTRRVPHPVLIGHAASPREGGGEPPSRPGHSHKHSAG
jgi:hypothetical protein